ncbi:hypothetical protein AZH53_00600 [Methanomicrobiaceae archaeon CYW5]|uniref:hypothetical protein n=1 Tax=Methanovulcanius yangii TaxID=1789227 RepID=UPI0029C9F23F|nr:hypothetical protein [Methanovulcanius yangii]MBT8506929.1 hypothetical protein [Methanovulcanius yangii]
MRGDGTIAVVSVIGMVFVILCSCFAGGCINIDGDDTPPLPSPNDIMVTKTDGNGATLWVTVLDTAEFEGFEDATETTDGRFAIVCIEYGHDRIQRLAFVEGDGTVGTVTVFDENPGGSWDSEVSALAGGSVSVFDGESDFVVIDLDGTVATEINVRNTAPPVWPIVAASPGPGDRTVVGWGEYYAVIEETGEVVWQEAYGDPELASRHPVLGLRNGDVAILAAKNTNPDARLTSDILHLLRLDAAGTILWDSSFPGDESQIWRTGIEWSLQEDADGNLLLLTTEEKTKSGLFGDRTSVVYTVRAFDGASGDIVSERSSGGHGSWECALLAPDGSVDSFAIADDALTLRRYDSDLEQVSPEITIEGEYDRQPEVIATRDGGYLIVSVL